MQDPEGNIRSPSGRILFTAKELRCKGSGLLILAPNFSDKLVALRREFNQPMLVVSGCRSEAHNRNEDGAKDSYHICDTGRGCCAVDVHTLNSIYRAKLMTIALAQGWSVGVHRRFLHLDRRTDYYPHNPQIVFLY